MIATALFFIGILFWLIGGLSILISIGGMQEIISLVLILNGTLCIVGSAITRAVDEVGSKVVNLNPPPP